MIKLTEEMAKQSGRVPILFESNVIPFKNLRVVEQQTISGKFNYFYFYLYRVVNSTKNLLVILHFLMFILITENYR